MLCYLLPSDWMNLWMSISFNVTALLFKKYCCHVLLSWAQNTGKKKGPSDVMIQNCFFLLENHLTQLSKFTMSSWFYINCWTPIVCKTLLVSCEWKRKKEKEFNKHKVLSSSHDAACARCASRFTGPGIFSRQWCQVRRLAWVPFAQVF